MPDGFDLSLTSPCVVRVQVHRFLLPTEQYVHSLCENPKAVDYRLSPVSQSGLVMANVTGMDEKKVCYLAEMSAGKQFFFLFVFVFYLHQQCFSLQVGEQNHFFFSFFL